MKSNKKIFAILTLVMFAMTMLPMAAFGATKDSSYSAAASTVSPSSTSISVYEDVDDLAKITVTFKDNTGKALAAGSPVKFYVKSDRDAEHGYVEGQTPATDTVPLDSTLYSLDGQGISVPVKTGGKVSIMVGSGISGTFKISVYNGRYDTDNGYLIGTANVSVSVGDGKIRLEGDSDVTGALAAAKAEKNVVAGDYITNQQNAGNGVELKAIVEDGSIAIEDVEVTFQAKYQGGSWYTIGTDITDDEGEATYYFEETKIGNYLYRAKTDDETSLVIPVKVNALATKTIELKTADGKKVGQKQNNSIDFYVKDKYGNLIKNFADTNYAVQVTSAPAGSKFEDMERTQKGISGAKVAVDAVTGDPVKMADGILRITFNPDKEGKYTLKVSDWADKRVSASIELEAIDFDEAVSMKLKVQNTYGEDVQALTRVYTTDTYGTETNEIAGKLVVTLVNEAGVELATTDDLTFASSDVSKVFFGDTTAGDLKIKANAIGTYTLTAYYAEDNISGTYELKVVGSPAALVATPSVTGKTATVSLQYVDTSGNNTWVVKTDGTTPDEQFRVILPAGVTSSNIKTIKKTGAGSFDLTAATAGTYPVTVITNDKGITKTFDVAFDVPASEKTVIGAQKVTMFIGATGYVSDGSALVTDVAPFIVDGRTFVAVRPVADAFGCEIGWNEATQTVTLTRADKVVTIVIGSNVITVVEGGVTTTVTADVAAFIKDGRTVLPFRAVGDAFGAAVEYDAATQAVTYEQ